VRRELNEAPVVADFQVGVVVFLVGDPGDRVDESDRVIKVFELELAVDPLAIAAYLPVRVHLLQQVLRLIRR
jgi:hypothetical protein